VLSPALGNQKNKKLVNGIKGLVYFQPKEIITNQEDAKHLLETHCIRSSMFENRNLTQIDLNRVINY
jgi:hypothetical protein